MTELELVVPSKSGIIRGRSGGISRKPITKAKKKIMKGEESENEKSDRNRIKESRKDWEIDGIT
jgi:hypothetical protein